jgi:hypothetical protein
MDGVGLGSADMETNPFLQADLSNLTELLGPKWFIKKHSPESDRISTKRASLVPTDANLETEGRPQSATGQATILTGKNIPQLVGEHYGPKPNPPVAELVKENNLFMEVVSEGGRAALITPYPHGFFENINSGRRLLSSVPLAATAAGLKLMNADDLREGRAVSPGFTGQGWHDYLGYTDMPILTLQQAGKQIAAIARSYNFSFFEHWPSDRSGHRGSMEDAVEHLEIIDQALGGLLDDWDDANDLLIITSDHGNIEEKNHRQHSRNPVPTIIIGPDHDALSEKINSLTDIASVIRTFLQLKLAQRSN